ncbi:4-coumarate--CoA ligase 2-like [Hyposmocoma kahamanoa]|uniref:4-coumarate--CoA ligase 2-like n=1 Tax=Hyposmocoma kahamanoa TaxID=1477025 RepID=UPI000E6D739C|nr:4-coumarate--CoA ligase 2-like [Hyposmocoma kahamanoa]
MQNSARISFSKFFRHVKQLKQRKFSASASVRKNEEWIIHSPYKDAVIPNMRFLDRLWKESKSFQNNVALECAETKKQYTYNQLQHYMAVFATSLRRKLGLQQGDVVAAMLPNNPEFVVVSFGALQAGCVMTTINPIYKELEISHQVSTTEPKLIVTNPECYEAVVKGLAIAKNNAKIVLVDGPDAKIPEGVIRYSEIAEKGEVDYKFLDTIEVKLEDTAFIPFSSGTTGLPKGVDISYKNLLAAIEIMQNKNHCFPQLAHGDFQDVVPCVLPFFHIYGLVVTLIGHLSMGCKLITLNKFSTGLFFDVLSRDKVSLLYVVPPIAILLGKHQDVKPEFFRNMRHIVCGAAPLAATDAEAVLKRSERHFEFNQGYGATETTSLTTTIPIRAKDVDYNSCGIAMSSVKLKFVDPQTGKTVPIGESGEMYVQSPTVMRGYYKNEKATKESLTEDGFFKTGDMGYYDPKKGLFITDRIKELIKVKGMQVAPAELESILRSHPAVVEAAVIGVPHDFNGESPKAFVVKKNGLSVSPEEIQDYVAGKVASFKKIEEVVFVEDIPKNMTGKILRKELKKMYA